MCEILNQIKAKPPVTFSVQLVHISVSTLTKPKPFIISNKLKNGANVCKFLAAASERWFRQNINQGNSLLFLVIFNERSRKKNMKRLMNYIRGSKISLTCVCHCRDSFQLTASKCLKVPGIGSFSTVRLCMA